MTAPDWKSAIEIHPAGWVCSAESFWIAGWITSAFGLVPVDVRAWLGAVPFLGLCGLPRPDKEIEARGRSGPPRAGFSFLLQPVPGALELRIEVRDQHGRWTEIFRQSVTSTVTAAPLATLSAGPEPLLRLLRVRHARPTEAWSALAHEVLTAETAESFDVMPSLPFKGALEEMHALAAVQYDHLLITGWVAHREQRITRLTAFLDTGTPLPLVHGLSRPDAGTLFPDLVDGAQSRFAGYLPIPMTAPRPLALRIFAELADGRQELVFLKRFRPVLVSGRGTDLPPFSAWTFGRAAWALRNNGWGTGWAKGELRRVLRDAWTEYRLAAPVADAPVSAPADPVPGRSRPLHVTLVTHNLNFEGAPLFLLEYARFLAAQPGWRVRLVSPQDGPLRPAFTEAGVDVTLVDNSAVQSAQSDDDFATALDDIAAAPHWAETDLLLANTVVSAWAVHLAVRLRKPCLFYVHESVSVRRFFALQLAKPAIARIEHAFALATRVVFIATAAQRAHAALNQGGNFRVLPGWIDVARIQTYAKAHDRTALRHELGLPENAIVFASIGSLLPRKAQHVYVEAVERLRRHAPAGAPMIFLLVGAKPGPDPYADLLRKRLADRPGDGLRLIEQSAGAYRYFHAADIFVCSSLEEALPRVVLEAAAFGLHIVTTDVDGIPEIVGPEEAWLVPPDDADRLADAMLAAADAHRRGDFSRARRAQSVVAARFDTAVLLPRHADLVRTVAGLSANRGS